MPAFDFFIASLGEATIPNPIPIEPERGYVQDDRVLYEPYLATVQDASLKQIQPPSFELAGPRQNIYFHPEKTRAAIITCGGLCPGLNAVIRGLVMQLWYRYGVRDIVGFRYGYQGLKAGGADPVPLDPKSVGDIHSQGGTILGSSRGAPPVTEMVDTLLSHKVDILFTIGGDGTLRGASAISDELAARQKKVSVVGIPKTIDNDIPYVRRSFGFETAVAHACSVIGAAHSEAHGVHNGIGLVKLMGRHSGYIAANTTLASAHVNYCLVPEVPFSLEGPTGLLARLEERFTRRDHAVIVVAEGAGQHYFSGTPVERDSSGNIRLGDIGVYLRDKIAHHFKGKGRNVPVRYIDPSYLIRAAAANPGDVLFCGLLAQNAVHAAMAGKTAMLVGNWHGHITHVPMKALLGKRQAIDPKGDLWFTVMEATGQPERIGS